MPEAVHILAVSDYPTLYEDGKIKTDLAEEVDCIVSCGDLPFEYLDELNKAFDAPVYFVRGNHDIRTDTPIPDGCVDIHMKLQQFKGLNILGLAGSHWYNGGPNQYTDSQMRHIVRKMKGTIRRNLPLDIIITHAPPRNIHDGEDLCHRGFEAYRRLIARYTPAYLFHGHIHQHFPADDDRITSFGETKVINCCGYFLMEYAAKNRTPANEVESFEVHQSMEEAFDYRKRGIRSVPLEKIIGSVRRYHDFDSKFRLKQHLPQERLTRIKKAMSAGKPLPPVDLFQIKDEYFILDGNHRVAAAKDFGFKEIQAHIVECLPQKKTWENILYNERAHFFETTDLPQSLALTEVGQYPYLLKQIAAHQEFLEKEGNAPVSLEKAAKDWYRSIYSPLAAIIEQGRFLSFFPDRTTADFYSYISYHQWGNWKELKEGEEIDDLISKNMEAFRRKMAEKENSSYQDMLREITAFILLNIGTKKEEQTIEKLFALEGVQEVHSVHGNVDILVKIGLTRDLLSSDAEIIGRFVQEKIRKIPGILSTQTLIPSISKKKS